MRWKISFLTDNPNSWIMPFVYVLEESLSRDHQVTRCSSYEDIPRGDMCFFLSCEKIVPSEYLKRNVHNLVVHPSRLPQGKGFSPLTWQVLDGENEIPISLFEAVEKVDSGCVYYRNTIKLKGHELNPEIKSLQGQQTVRMVMRFINDYPNIKGEFQRGEESFYKRRSAKDSELDVDKTIAEQFNLLRVVDNDRYPAFFRYRGHKYVLRIHEREE